MVLKWCPYVLGTGCLITLKSDKKCTQFLTHHIASSVILGQFSDCYYNDRSSKRMKYPIISDGTAFKWKVLTGSSTQMSAAIIPWLGPAFTPCCTRRAYTHVQTQQSLKQMSPRVKVWHTVFHRLVNFIISTDYKCVTNRRYLTKHSVYNCLLVLKPS